MARGALRLRALLASAAGGVALLVLAVMARVGLPLSALYPFKVALVYGSMMTIVVTRIERHHPFPRLGSANQLTTARAVLVALIAGVIGESANRTVAGSVTTVAILCVILDGVDGWLARRGGMASTFGARFDMETDALLVLVLSLVVWQFGKAGPWVLVCGLMRYLFAASGWLLPWMAKPLSPTNRGRAVAVVQMVGLAVAAAPIIPTPFSTAAAAITLAALCWSFAIDVGRLWSQRARA